MKFQSATMYRNVMLFVITILCGAASGATVNRGLLVETALLESVGLKADWQVNLPMRAGESIEQMYVFDRYVYLRTNQNYLYVVDIEKQAFRFGVQLATRGLPVRDPLFRDGQAWFVVGSDLIAVDPKAGGIDFKRPLKHVGRNAVGQLDSNSRRLYVPGSDKRLHSIVLDGYWQDFMVAAEDGAQVNSVVADDEHVVLSTESGHVISIWPDQARRRWGFDIVGRITAPIVRDDDWVYVSGLNAKLYKLNIRTGRSAWRDAFHAGEPLKKSAFVGKRLVYQSAQGNGVYAVDKQSGKSVWNVPAGVDVLAETETRAYVYAEPGMLVVMDNGKGSRVYSINFSTVRKYAINMMDDSLYVADLQGRVMCIKERNRR